MSVNQPQHLAALAEANQVRLSRADVKRELFAGRISLADALSRPCVASMPVFDLVAAQCRWGPARTVRRLSGLQIGMTKTVAQLSERQRLALVEAERRDKAA